MGYTLRCVLMVGCFALLQSCAVPAGSIPPFNSFDVVASLTPTLDAGDTQHNKLGVRFAVHYDVGADTLMCNDVKMSRSIYAGQYTLPQPVWGGDFSLDRHYETITCHYHHAGKDTSFSIPVHQPAIVLSPTSGQVIHHEDQEIRLQAPISQATVVITADKGRWATMVYSLYNTDRYTLPRVAIADGPDGAAIIIVQQPGMERVTGTPFRGMSYSWVAASQVPVTIAP